MAQHIALFTVTVHDYDEAVAFYTQKLGFELLEDTDLGEGKRWVRVRPAGSSGAAILLARAASDEQRASVGHQTGGRVFVFIETDDLRRDHEALVARGVTFVRPPVEEPYGTVAVFEDLYGNQFDLIERRYLTDRDSETNRGRSLSSTQVGPEAPSLLRNDPPPSLSRTVLRTGERETRNLLIRRAKHDDAEGGWGGSRGVAACAVRGTKSPQG